MRVPVPSARMIKPLLAALAVVTATAVPASAGSDSSYEGGCGYDAMTSPAGADPDVFHGVLYAQAVVYSPSDPAEPVAATITCTLSVDDGPTFVSSFSGTTVVRGGEEIAFTADHPFDLGLCESVDFHDDTPTRDVCYAYTAEQFPPQELYDALDAVLAVVPGSKGALCGAVRAAETVTPDVWGTLLVTDEGDVFLGKYQVWHCP